MKRAVSILAAVFMAAAAFAAFAAEESDVRVGANMDNVRYIDENGVARTRNNVRNIDRTSKPKENEGIGMGLDTWYIARGKLTVDTHVNFVGNVHLILEDGADITFTKGLGVVASNSKLTGTLTIYAQSTGDSMGKLTVKSTPAWRAGIGGGNEQDSGAITINGGVIDVTGGQFAAGIGGGTNANGKKITINGGRVTVKGGLGGAGIGGGSGSLGMLISQRKGGRGEDITINGGTVRAEGGLRAAGIGGGEQGEIAARIKITGGSVTAIGGRGAAGIGGANGGEGAHRTDAKEIEILGGIVEARGGEDAPGIGGGSHGNVTDLKISGGVVRAVGGENAPAVGSGSAKVLHDASNEITVQGGTLYATAGKNSASAIGGRPQNKLISGADGRAFIAASVLNCDMSQFVSGVVFVAKDGTVHGSPTLLESADLPSGGKLVVKSGQTLTISKDMTLNATSGDIELDGGTLVNDGLISLPASYKDKILSKQLVIKGTGALEFAGDSAVYNNDGSLRSEAGGDRRSASNGACSSGTPALCLLAIIPLTRQIRRRS